MTNILLRWRKKIPNHIVEILQLVFSEADKNGIQLFVVGATARDLIFEYVYETEIHRATEDIDFGVAVGSWAEYEQLKKLLAETGKFKLDKKVEQRIWWKDDSAEMKIDLIPYGKVEYPKGHVSFPPDGDFMMSTVGFAEAFESSWELKIDENFKVKIVSLAGLVMLKFIAYNDNSAKRRRDVQDIWFIAKNYLKAGNEDRIYEQDADLLDEVDFDTRICGARLLGRDIALILRDKALSIVTETLADEESGGKLEKLADVISSENLYDEAQYKFILKTLTELRRGILERVT